MTAFNAMCGRGTNKVCNNCLNGLALLQQRRDGSIACAEFRGLDTRVIAGIRRSTRHAASSGLFPRAGAIDNHVAF